MRLPTWRKLDCSALIQLVSESIMLAKAGTSVSTPHYGEVSMNLNRRSFVIFSTAAFATTTLPFFARAAVEVASALIRNLLRIT